MSRPKVLAVVGPTAAGKSELALRLAEATGGEIISADSVQVYRGMDIGSAKPSPAEQKRVPHHMIDVADASEEYSVGRFQTEAREAIASVHGRGRLPIVVGGSGLYVNAITYGLDLSCRPEADPVLREALAQLTPEELYRRLAEADPEAAARIHPNNRVRVQRALEIALSGRAAPYDFESDRSEYSLAILGVVRPRAELYERINARVDQMMAAGLADEVRSLYARCRGARALQAIGYKEIIACLEGKVGTLEEAAELIKRNTRHFAKRQLTWFRRDPRIKWLEPEGQAAEEIAGHLEFLP